MNSINKYLANAVSESTFITEIQQYHPFFKSLTFQGARMIFQCSAVVRLRPSQILFREGSKECVAYIILCGKIVIRNMDQGVLGVIGLRDTVGEEAFLSSNYFVR